AGGAKCHMVHGPGTLQRGHVAVSEVFLQAIQIVWIDADDVHHTERFRIAAAVVEPRTGKFERRSKADGESHDPSVEILGGAQIERADRIVVQLTDRHTGLSL